MILKPYYSTSNNYDLGNVLDSPWHDCCHFEVTMIVQNNPTRIFHGVSYKTKYTKKNDMWRLTARLWFQRCG